MCGIAGILSFDKTPDRNDINLMISTLAHRGPDGEGVECVGPIGFGHKRLSIIDLKTGKQPMWSHDGRFLITFNGEIYNYLELKDELHKSGHKFLTNSDTEVILEAFRKWGVDSFRRLNGQFAFAIYDKQESKVYLARDYFGEKPLYTYQLGKDFLFASELKALVALARFRNADLVISADSFSDYTSLNYLPFEETLIKGITKLPPASYLEINQNSKNVGRIEFADSYNGAPLNPSKDLIDLIDSSTKIRLRSDVPIGVFLSSGVDSALTAISAMKATQNLTAFTANFLESSFSEVPGSKRLAQKLGIKHEIIDIDLAGLDLPSFIEKLVYHGDEPLADSSALPVYLLSEATSKKVKVVLSGDGGDELFGGYLTYDATLFADQMPRWLCRILPKLSNALYFLKASNQKVSFQEKTERFLRNLNLTPRAAHFAWNGMFQENEKQKLLGPLVLDAAGRETVGRKTFNLMAETLLSNSAKLTRGDLMMADQQSYLTNDILNKTDRMSMAHGLEVRPIFLDPHIASYSRNIMMTNPELIKNKKILKEILAHQVGSSFVDSKKRGFSIPVHLWFRTRLKDFAGDLFSSQLVKESGLYNQTTLQSLWSQHQSRKRNYGFELWGIMVALLWYRRFMRK